MAAEPAPQFNGSRTQEDTHIITTDALDALVAVEGLVVFRLVIIR